MRFDLGDPGTVVLPQGGGVLVADPGTDPIDRQVILVQAVIPSRELGGARGLVDVQATQEFAQVFVEVVPIDRFVIASHEWFGDHRRAEEVPQLGRPILHDPNR